MGWGCYRHEIDDGSDEWVKAEEELCGRKLDEQPRTFGRDGRICPKCYEELEKAHDDAKYDERKRIIDYLLDVERWTKPRVMSLLNALDAPAPSPSREKGEGKP